MRFLVVIPAKSGSKRLPDKNMRKIGNKTLIEIAIEYAKKSNREVSIVVSTDSSKIKDHVESANLCKCIMRGENLSGEAEVFEVYENARELCNEEVDYVVGLQPDNPDRKLGLDEAISYVIENNLDTPRIIDIITLPDIYIPLIVFLCLVIATIFLRKFFYKK